MINHATKFIKVGKRSANIDLKIAPLVKLLWELDIDTCNSCEENRPGVIWIEFFSSYDAEKFVNIIAKYDDPETTIKNEPWTSLYRRITNGHSNPDADVPDTWIYHTTLMDMGVDKWIENDEVQESFTGKHSCLFQIHIRFPQKDLKTIVKRLKAYKSGLEKIWVRGK